MSNPSIQQGQNFKNNKTNLKNKYFKSGPNEKVSGPINYLANQYEVITNSKSGIIQEDLLPDASNSIYKNKYVQLSNGAVGYVTNENVYKWIENPTLLSGMNGVNGCPTNNSSNYIVVDLSDSSIQNYNQPGNAINTNPPLLVGNPITALPFTCGPTNKNVISDKFPSNDEIVQNNSFQGCFSSNSTTLPQYLEGVSSFKECNINAYQYGATNFSYSPENQLCFINNSTSMTKVNNSSTTVNNNVVFQYFNGMYENDLYPNFVSQIPSPSFPMTTDVSINSFSVDVSYNNQNITYNIGYQSFGTKGQTFDTQGWCDNFSNNSFWATRDYLMVTSSGQIGFFNSSTKIMMFSLGNQSQICSTSIPNTQNTNSYCNFYLYAHNNGSIYICEGLDPSTFTKNNIVSTLYSYPNPDDLVSTSTYSTASNYLTMNSQKYAGLIVSSNNGVIQLWSDSVNSIYITCNIGSNNPFCPLDSSGNTVNSYINTSFNSQNQLVSNGNTNYFGIYNITNPYTGGYGNYGYINNESILQPYPQSGLTGTSNYDTYPNFTFQQSLNENYPSQSDAETACNQSDNCVGYFNDGNNNFILIDKTDPQYQGFPQGRNYSTNNKTSLYMKKYVINSNYFENSNSCLEPSPSNTINITPTQWNNYQKGQNMSGDSSCGLMNKSTYLNNTTDKQNDLLNKISNASFKGANNNANIYNSYIKGDSNTNTTNINNIDNNNTVENFDTMNSLSSSSPSIKMLYNIHNNNNKYKKLKTDINEEKTTLNARLNDTDLLVLKENYQYVFWSVFTLALIIITLDTYIRK
jgi:hypothetical protein